MSARRLLCSVFVVVVGALLFASAPAWAAPPEAPELTVESVAATSARLQGVLNPHAAGDPGSYEFRYRASATECEGAGGEASGGSALGHEKEAVKAEVALSPNTTYTFCLRAYNEAGETSLSSLVTFSTPVAAPVVESESSADVDATEVRLEAQVNPGNSETSYHFEYGLGVGSYDMSTPVGKIPARLTGMGVNVVLNGLAPGTTYHYRVVASNALPGSVDGVDKAFTTPTAQGSGSPADCPNEQLRAEQPYGLGLPDCRAYEMVSPVNTEGQDATDPFVNSVWRASASGEAVTYASRGDFADAKGSTLEDQFLSRRGPEGWSTQAITPLHHPLSTETPASFETTAFTPELTEGIASTNASLTGESPETENIFGLYVADFANDSYQYIEAGNAINEPVDTDGTSTDLSHVVVGVIQPETSAPIKLWMNGKVTLVNVANDGEGIAAHVGSGRLHLPHAISADGKRVYFTGKNNGELYLRLNAEQSQSPMNGEKCTVAADACTVDVSASQKTNGNGPGGTDPSEGAATFWSANTDGSTVFFTSSRELTNDANTGVRQQKIALEEVGSGTFTLTFKGQTTAPIFYEASAGEVQSALEALSSIGAGNVTVNGGPAYHGANYLVTFNDVLADSEQPSMTVDGSSLVGRPSGGPIAVVRVAGRPGNDLYEYDVENGKLRDLTVDTLDTAGAAVQGVVETSEDGSYVYFVADGELAEGATAGEPNLYVSHDDGPPRFIATLAKKDVTDWEGPEIDTTAVAATGTRLAFVSERSLTGYDNEQIELGRCENKIPVPGRLPIQETGECREIYLYDAETNRIVCASCNPSGARPVGPANLTVFNYGSQLPRLYRQRNLLENGTLFFNSGDALVPHASDGRLNVYEYEDGHVYPISDVAGGYESFFMDSSPSGDDVFFGSADQLLPQDRSNNVVVYDARVDGGFPVAVSSPSCDNGDSCKSPPAPQPGVFGAPGSATFSGPGNIAPTAAAKSAVKAKAKSAKCKKGYEKKKNKCVKKPRKKKAKKSSDRKRSK